MDLCDCETCQDSGKPCAFDCDAGEECVGCKEALLEFEDRLYEWTKNRGSL